MTIRLLLADGHRAFVEALALRLDAEPDLVVAGVVVQPEDVLPVVAAQQVDVAVLTVGVAPDFLGTGARLAETRPGTALVAVAEDDDLALVTGALRAGFRAWVPKAVGVTALVQGVRAVHRGESWIPPLLLTSLLPYLLDRREAEQAPDAPFAALTSREADVLRAMARGATRPEIAAELAISAHTVRTHTQNIFTKLGVHTSLAAVALARRAGLG